VGCTGQVAPAAINYRIVTPGRTLAEKELNAKYVISAARKLGCSILLLWEDIVEVGFVCVT
jgi:plastin-1